MIVNRFSVITVSMTMILGALTGCPGNPGGGGGGGGTGGQGNLPPLELANVDTETNTARKSTITEDGGTLSVTDANGVVYTLTIPESALAEETEISMYPVNGVSTLPADAQVLGGVHFLPDGLELQLAATFTMEFPEGTDLASLYAVTYSADGADPALNISLKDERTLTMQLQHFSGGLAVSGRDALLALGLDPRSSVGVIYLNQIARISQDFAPDDPALTDAVLPIYVRWYEEHVRPSLEYGGTADFSFTGVFDEGRRVYEEWRSVAAMTGILPLLQPQVNDATPLAAAYLTNRFNFLNDQCKRNAESPAAVSSAAFALEVGALARQWGVPLQSNNLHDEYLLDNLCVKVAIDTLLPNGLDRAGDRGTLTVGAHYAVNGGPARTDLPIRVRLTREGSPFGDPSAGRQDSSGFFESDITWPAAVDPLVIDVYAHLDRSGLRKIARFDRVTIGCTPPQVNSIRPDTGGRFQTAVFRADITGTPTSYEWNFGGGAEPNTSTEEAPFVTFGDVGSFQGSLTLTSDCSGSTVHFFVFEVDRVRFDSYDYLGTITETYPLFGIDCSGPATASFEYVTVSGFPEFRIQYEFDCPGRPNRPAVLFPFDQSDMDEVSFVTRDGLGSGEVLADHLTFQWNNDVGTTSFEGNVAPP